MGRPAREHGATRPWRHEPLQSAAPWHPCQKKWLRFPSGILAHDRSARGKTFPPAVSRRVKVTCRCRRFSPLFWSIPVRLVDKQLQAPAPVLQMVQGVWAPPRLPLQPSTTAKAPTKAVSCSERRSDVTPNKIVATQLSGDLMTNRKATRRAPDLCSLSFGFIRLGSISTGPASEAYDPHYLVLP